MSRRNGLSWAAGWDDRNGRREGKGVKDKGKERKKKEGGVSSVAFSLSERLGPFSDDIGEKNRLSRCWMTYKEIPPNYWNK